MWRWRRGEEGLEVGALEGGGEGDRIGKVGIEGSGE